MKKIVCVMMLCGLLSASAFANLTSVYQTSWGPVSGYTEKDLAPGLPEFTSNPGGSEPVNGADDYQPGDVLSEFYGSWTRIDDDMDQIWQDLNGGVTVKAKYTSSSLTLQYSLDEVNGTGKVSLGVGLPGQTNSFDIMPNSNYFIWFANDLSSNPDLNSGGNDRMVTYRIDTLLGGSAPSTPTYVIGFEDGTDWDFQDLVVEVSNVAPVPVPGAVLLGLLGLSVAGARLRKRS